LKAFFVLFYDVCFPRVIIGIEVTGRNDIFGRDAAVRTGLVNMGERKIIAAVSLPAPHSDAL
jgi:hypothetical protein